MQEPVPAPNPQGVRQSLVQLTHIIYALHAIAVLVGVTSAATVAGGFVFGLPSLVAVFINYLKRSDVNGTWLESHFRWQIRTFWFTALWLVVYGLLLLVSLAIISLGVTGFAIAFVIGLPFAFGFVALLGLWVGYRVIRGWVALADSRPVG